MKQILLFLTLTIVAATSALNARPMYPVTTDELRLESAQTHLRDKPNQVAVYSRGLVCYSCGIGLRIQIKKLEGIDKTQLDKGMLLDAKNQLVLIAFKPDFTPDLEKIREAVDRAGYESTHYYHWDGEAVQLKVYEEEK